MTGWISMTRTRLLKACVTTAFFGCTANVLRFDSVSVAGVGGGPFPPNSVVTVTTASGTSGPAVGGAGGINPGTSASGGNPGSGGDAGSGGAAGSSGSAGSGGGIGGTHAGFGGARPKGRPPGNPPPPPLPPTRPPPRPPRGG